MKFAILGVLIILVIAFLVLLWKASKHWRWYHLVGAFFTMALAITFIFPTAYVLKSRAAWHQVKERLEKQTEAVESENRVIKYGDTSDANAGEGLLELSQKLANLGKEAGRRWRHLRLQNANNQSVILSAPPAAAPPPGVAPAAGDDAAAAPPPPNLPPQNLVVYGFAEAPALGAAEPLPVFFLGEFRVTASAGNQITLAPTGKLEQGQLQRISDGQAPMWSLYEMLPLDGHVPFIAEGSLPDNDNIFGRIDDALVKQLLGNKIREATLQNYLRDGSRSNPDDVPLSRWVKIEFTQNHKVDVDSPSQQGALEGGFFDESGRSVDSRLQRGEDGTVSFRKDDQIIVKEEAAKQFIDVDGVARLIDTYYMRPLNDYRFVLRRLRLRLTEAAIRTQELEFERKVLEDAIAATVSMLTTNQTAKLKLEQDLEQVGKELKAIRDYESTVSAEVEKTREALRNLYQENLQLEQELERLHGTS
ncbi:MAG: hypothetical protein HKN47_05310 [Pirellulaceae bacterium]|nr:hypothetical protein [Pirellulaceae bacterium]